MKKNHPFISAQLLILIIIIACISCKKNSKPEEVKFVSQCTINGVVWKADITGGAYYGQTNLIGFGLTKNKNIYDNVYVPWDNLGFNFVKKSLDKQSVWGNRRLSDHSNDTNFIRGVYGTSDYDGDVSCDLYYCLETDSVNNWVQITKEENDYQKIWGKFSMTLLRYRGCANSVYPDTLYIRDGEFYAEIEPR